MYWILRNTWIVKYGIVSGHTLGGYQYENRRVAYARLFQIFLVINFQEPQRDTATPSWVSSLLSLVSTTAIVYALWDNGRPLCWCLRRRLGPPLWGAVHLLLIETSVIGWPIALNQWSLLRSTTIYRPPLSPSPPTSQTLIPYNRFEKKKKVCHEWRVREMWKIFHRQVWDHV